MQVVVVCVWMSGTHYVRHMLMGGRSVYTVSVSSSDYAEMKSQSLDVSAAVEGSFMAAQGAAEAKVSTKYSSYAKFSTYNKKTSLYGVPVPAPQCGADELCGDTSAWEAAIQLPDGQPVPLHMKMLTISSMLVPSNFPYLDGSAVTAARNKLNAYHRTSYCQDVAGCFSTTVSEPVWHEWQNPAASSGRTGPISSTIRGEWSFKSAALFQSSIAITGNGTVIALDKGGNL